METFEIHITGNKSIIAVARDLNIKNISVDLLRPDKTFLRTEYMTSDVKKFASYDLCKTYVDELVETMKSKKVEIVRVKIESPYYPHYRDQSCYIESHFEAKDDRHPISRNQRKTTYLSTDRTYKKEEYQDFINKYKGYDVELCLYDSNIPEDADWFALYG